MFGERLEAAILSKTSETVGGFRIVGTGISRDTRIADYREILQLAVIFSKKLGVLKTRIAKLRSSHQRNIIRSSRSCEDRKTVSVTDAPIAATAFRPKPSGPIVAKRSFRGTRVRREIR